MKYKLTQSQGSLIADSRSYFSVDKRSRRRFSYIKEIRNIIVTSKLPAIAPIQIKLLRWSTDLSRRT